MKKKLKEDYHWRHRHRLDNHSLADISRAMLNRSGKVDRRSVEPRDRWRDGRGNRALTHARLLSLDVHAGTTTE